MRKVQLHPVPTLALSCHDLECLRLIILAHITHTRRTSKPTGERQEHLAVLDTLYTRLASVPASVSDIAFFLSIAEVAALCGAIRGVLYLHPWQGAALPETRGHLAGGRTDARGSAPDALAARNNNHSRK